MQSFLQQKVPVTEATPQTKPLLQRLSRVLLVLRVSAPSQSLSFEHSAVQSDVVSTLSALLHVAGGPQADAARTLERLRVDDGLVRAAVGLDSSQTPADGLVFAAASAQHGGTRRPSAATQGQKQDAETMGTYGRRVRSAIMDGSFEARWRGTAGKRARREPGPRSRAPSPEKRRPSYRRSLTCQLSNAS